MGNDEARDEKGICGNGELFKSPNLMRPFLEQRVDNVGSFIVREKIWIGIMILNKLGLTGIVFAMQQSKLRLTGLKC